MHASNAERRSETNLELGEDIDEEDESVLYQPLQIEEKPTRNKNSNANVPFIHRPSTIISLIFVVVMMSLMLIGYLVFDTDQNSDIIGVDTEEKENITEKFVVQKGDGAMYETVSGPLDHDKDHFTQGLTYSKSSDVLFQSNGLTRKSSVCRLNATTGSTLNCVGMDTQYFGEGMQVYGKPGQEKLIQITWKSRDGFIYDSETLDVIDKFSFSTARNEGWGICYDMKNHTFIVSDGSEFLHFWDADTLKEKYRIAVTRMGGNKAKHINELEFVNGKVLANIWFEDVIVVIDPQSGECESEYDMSDLWPLENRTYRPDVLNGISISKDDGILYVTGKLWDRMFRLKLLGFS